MNGNEKILLIGGNVSLVNSLSNMIKRRGFDTQCLISLEEDEFRKAVKESVSLLLVSNLDWRSFTVKLANDYGVALTNAHPFTVLSKSYSDAKKGMEDCPVFLLPSIPVSVLFERAWDIERGYFCQALTTDITKIVDDIVSVLQKK